MEANATNSQPEPVASKTLMVSDHPLDPKLCYKWTKGGGNSRKKQDRERFVCAGCRKLKDSKKVASDTKLPARYVVNGQWAGEDDDGPSYPHFCQPFDKEKVFEVKIKKRERKIKAEMAANSPDEKPPRKRGPKPGSKGQTRAVNGQQPTSSNSMAYFGGHPTMDSRFVVGATTGLMQQMAPAGPSSHVLIWSSPHHFQNARTYIMAKVPEYGSALQQYDQVQYSLAYVLQQKLDATKEAATCCYSTPMPVNLVLDELSLLGYRIVSVNDRHPGEHMWTLAKEKGMAAIE